MTVASPTAELVVEVDGRRLTGLSHWAPGPAAAVIVSWGDHATEADKTACWERWSSTIRAAMASLSWPEPKRWRRSAGAREVWCASAPIDRLYAAVALVESVAGGGDVDAALSAARGEEDLEGDAAMLAWQRWAERHQVPYLWCDDYVSVGHGHRSRTWSRAELPQTPEDDLVSELGTVPTAIITGTNGKTTTSRLLNRILASDGLCVGATGTDGLVVADEVIDAGDWTGPGGARVILRRPEVEAAVLEAARGGMLRRGLGLVDVDASAVTNVSDDHLGEWGIDTVTDMASVKLLVARAVRPGGRFVYFDDGATLTQVFDGAGPQVEVLRYCDRPPSEATAGAAGRLAAWIEADPDEVPTLVVDCGAPDAQGSPRPALRISARDVPISVGGAARYNVANALCAALLARGMGASDAAIRDGLRRFTPTATDSPGRCNLLTYHGARVLLDFGHNPDGLRRVAEMASNLPARRRLVVTGQAGDRTDDEIAGLVRGLLHCRPDRWILKAMPKYARGRAPNEVISVLRGALKAADVSEEQISDWPSEASAVEAALSMLQEGDLLLLFIQADAAGALDALKRAGAVEGWSDDD